jgi:hypothetical protein
MTSRLRGAAFLVLVIGCVFGTYVAPVGARGQDNGLATANRLACSFTLISTGTWTNGQAEASLDTSTLEFQFESINTQEATAEVIGPFGPSHIITRLSGDYLHFVQMLSAGPLYTTTVFNRETVDGKLMAVHTRHEYTDVSLIGFTSRPEQYYGDCEVSQ